MRSDQDALVSVIVPIYNVEKYLDQCLDSISDQTHQNLEIICINDGSTDSSLEIIKRHAEKDSRIRVIDKENGGYGVGCNLGIREARGTWISIIEPDDWIDVNMYSDMLSFAAQFEQKIDVIKTPWWNVERWNNPSKQRNKYCKLHKRIPTSTEPFTLEKYPLLIEIHPGIWSAIYRKDFLDENGIRFPEYPGAGWADNPFLVHTLCLAKNIVFLDKAYYYYRADLLYSTLNHKSDDAIARPFDRWIDMTELMERIGVTDLGIWQAHYLRGFNYIDGAKYDDGENNPIVVEKTKEVFRHMKKEYVLNNPKLNKTRKRQYLTAMGMDTSHIPMKGRLRHFVRETCETLKLEGPWIFTKRVGILIRGAAKHPKTDKKIPS